MFAHYQTRLLIMSNFFINPGRATKEHKITFQATRPD
jgi:hypothetical protein